VIRVGNAGQREPPDNFMCQKSTVALPTYPLNGRGGSAGVLFPDQGFSGSSVRSLSQNHAVGITKQLQVVSLYGVIKNARPRQKENSPYT